MEFYFEANGIDSDVTKRAILLSQIGAAAYELLRSLVSPLTPRDLTYNEIIERLNEHFNPVPNEIVERFNFNRRVQKFNEPIADFVADLRKLSAHCNFAELDNMLRDRMVCGVNDETLQIRLFSETNLSFQRAYELALSAEMANKNVLDIRGRNNSEVLAMQLVKNRNYYKNTKSNSSEAGPSYQRQRACKHCSGSHESERCKFKNVTCYWCHDKGHVKSICPKRQNKITNANNRGVNQIDTENNDDENHDGENQVYTLNHIDNVSDNNGRIYSLNAVTSNEREKNTWRW